MWNAPDTYTEDRDDLVQVLCEVLPDEVPEDGFKRACHLAISSGDHAEGDQFVSIGFKHAACDEHEGEWFVAGWNMTQDCWTDARCFRVLGWLPMATA